ncbi:MAG: hypothetical protein GX333_04980 [Syntrophomonadaceae bacterium]|nr:hypothetical protein [Syntrophomonadaceae bacterium]
MGRTLVATALYSSKGKEIYCTTPKVSNEQLRIIKNTPKEELEEVGFTFINLSSQDYHNIRGYALFFEGHINEMNHLLKQLHKKGWD